MSLPLIFNHHALPFANKAEAQAGFLLWLRLLKDCRPYGIQLLLVDETQDASLMRVALSDGFYVSDWVAEAKRDVQLTDWLRVFKSLQTRQPLFSPVDESDMDNAVEVGLNNLPASNVMKAVNWFDTWLCSFTSDAYWCANTLVAWKLDLRQSEQVKVITLKNLVNEASFKHYQPALASYRESVLNDGRAIWEQSQTLWQGLILLDNQIGGALKQGSIRPDILNKARDALIVLNEFAMRWQSGEFADYQHRYLSMLGLQAEISGESDTVFKNENKRKKREFWLNDGRKVYCANHIKLPSGFRLHFYPDAQTHKIVVAYLGVHLPL